MRIVFGFSLAGLATAALIYSGFAPAPPVPENLLLFVGCFHPIFVHLPIGFLAAIAALQVLQWVFRFEFRTASCVLLWLCALSAIASTALGTLLIWPGGYSGEILDDHRWFGIATSVVCVWMLVMHHFPSWLDRAAYTLLLFASLGLVSATGHFGGYKLILGRFPLSREEFLAAVAADPAKYGTLIGPKATATISTDTPHTLGAWSGKSAFTPAKFSYQADGSGDIRLRISAAGNKTDDRFIGCIDNLTVKEIK